MPNGDRAFQAVPFTWINGPNIDVSRLRQSPSHLPTCSPIHRNYTRLRQTSAPMDSLPKPTRIRKWLRWLALPAVAVILALAYYLTRPPELVWWTSPPLGKTGQHRVRVKVPTGWDMTLTSY